MVRLPRARKALKWVLRAGAAVVCLLAAGTLLFALHCSNFRGEFRPSPSTLLGKNIPGYARPEDDTFLTYAEWYIVWSYLEKAAWQEAHLPSGFRYFGAIRQYWGGYCCSYSVVRGRYPFNFGDHLMLLVIGTSFTLEYGIKGIYENSVGRLTEWIAGDEPVEEDRYAARVARNYGLFVEDRPFYEFPFSSAFRALWKETSLWGPHVFRKWERKVWLSLDYGIEAVYCGLIRVASHAVYGIEEDVTYALIEHAPEGLLASLPSVRRVNQAGPDSFIVEMPRYQKFTGAAGQLLRGQAGFVEIAGNTQIMVTAVVPRDWSFQLPAGELLFSSGVLTDAQSKRVALRVPVAHLGAVADRLTIEHIFDY